jgi:hypothetical protein
VSHLFGIVIESLVAALLMLKRLKLLKADEHSLKATIGELITATEIAERAIGSLKLTVRDVNEHLGNKIASATDMSEQLKKQLVESDNVLRRLTKIAVAARPPAVEPAPVSTTKTLLEAAQAFTERRRSDGIAA